MLAYELTAMVGSGGEEETLETEAGKLSGGRPAEHKTEVY